MGINIRRWMRYLLPLPTFYLCYKFWILTLERSWLHSQIRKVHPEYYRPAQHRYDPDQCVRTMESEIDEINSPPKDFNLRTKLLKNVKRNQKQ